MGYGLAELLCNKYGSNMKLNHSLLRALKQSYPNLVVEKDNQSGMKTGS